MPAGVSLNEILLRYILGLGRFDLKKRLLTPSFSTQNNIQKKKRPYGAAFLLTAI